MANEAIQHVPSCWTTFGLTAGHCNCDLIAERARGEERTDTSIPITMNTLQVHREVTRIYHSKSDELPKLPEEQVQWLNRFLSDQEPNAMDISTDLDDTSIDNEPAEAAGGSVPSATDRFSCEKCGHKFDHHFHYKLHTEREHDVPCLTCGLMFASKKSMNAHCSISHPETVFKCRFCDASFDNKYALNRHINHSCKNKSEPME